MSVLIQQQDNRRVFIDTLCELAEGDERVVLIVPDVGFNYITKFQEKFPKQFFNFGVTEQACILIAAGLALSGFKPYVYSMINFVLFRPYEMIRNGIIHHQANVKLLGIKGSEGYKMLGFSHNLTDDDEDRRVCKNLQLDGIWPVSLEHTRQVILETYQKEKAYYIRL